MRTRRQSPTWDMDSYYMFTGGSREKSMIYFIRSRDFIKIGVSNDVRHRITTLQVSNPDEVQFLGCIDGNRQKERRLHQKFSAFKHRNEWFHATKELLGIVEDILRVHGNVVEGRENPTLTIRIAKDLKRALEKAAKADDRSVTSYIIHVVKEQLGSRPR